MHSTRSPHRSLHFMIPAADSRSSLSETVPVTEVYREAREAAAARVWNKFGFMGRIMCVLWLGSLEVCRDIDEGD